MSVYKEQEYTKSFDFQLWKQIFEYTKPYKKQILQLALIMMAVGGVDVTFPLMSKYAIDRFVIPGNIEGLGPFALTYFVLAGFQTFNVWLLITTAGKIEMNVSHDIRKKGFLKLQELSFSYYDKTPVGWMMARMTSDIDRLSEILSWGLVDLVWGSTLMSAIMVVLLYLNWKLALITLLVVPLLAWVSLYFQRKILASYRQVRKINSRITGAFNEGIMGAKTSKTLVREDRNLEEFREITKDMYGSSVRAAIFSSIFLPIVLALGSVGTGLALWFGGKGVVLEAISYGTLVAFISYTIQFFEPVRELARIIAELQAAQASAERVLSMINSKPQITDREQVTQVYGDVFHPKKENWPEVHGNIAFQKVSFTYDDGEQVLENFSLEVQAGEKIALVGETGSGKSTIVNLLCRFYEPTEGGILIDGVDYRQRSQLWLQSNLGYVLQTPHLFSGTILENIRYGRLEATVEEVEEAARLANAHEFIMKFPLGYESEVGEGGNLLSTGEKQLVSFARAILADPKIFVLDEATSSIDTETEQMIQQAIEKVLEGRTSFIIAHRLSTIRSADRILVIGNGKILESGNHKDLIKKRGHYYNLYTHQFKAEKENQLLQAQ